MRFQKYSFCLILGFFLSFCQTSGAQINLQRYFDDFDNGTTTEQIAAVRGVAAFVIRQTASEEERTQILAFLTENTSVDDPVVRLGIHTELLKIAGAEDDTDLAMLAMAAADDKNLNVRREMLKYFRTFFSKRRNFANAFEKLMFKKLDDEDLDIRFQSASTLHAWGISNRRILEILVDAMQLSNYRAGITYALVSDQSHREQTIQAISQRLRESKHYAGVYINLLSLMTPEANRLMPVILDMIDSDQIAVRAAVVAAIGRMQVEKEKSLEVLKSAIDDVNPMIRQLSVSALIRMDPDLPFMKDAVLKLLADSDTSVAEVGASSFFFFEPDFEFLAKDLRRIFAENDRRTTIAVLNGLAICGPMAAELTPDVIQLLQHENFDIRIRSCWALNEIANNQEQIVSAYNKLLETESNDATILAAITALSQQKPTDQKSKAQFLKHLDSKNDSLRLACLQGLSAYRDETLVDRIMQLDRKQNRRFKNNLNILDTAIVQAVVATGDSGIAKAAAFLKSDNPVFRARALRVMGRSRDGIDRESALQAMRSSNPLVSYCGAIAASKMKSPDEAVLNQMMALTDGNQRQRTANILKLFGEMGDNVAPVVPEIARLLDEKYRGRFANDAKRVLVKLGEAAAPAMEVLLSGTLNIHKLDCIAAIGKNDSNSAGVLREYIDVLRFKIENNRNVAARQIDVRNLLFAAAALSRVSDDSDTAAEIIEAELDGENLPVALICIQKMVAPPERLLNALIERLPDKSVIQSLGNLGDKAKVATEALEKLVESTDKEAARLAKQSIWQINDDPKYAIQVVNQLLHENRYELVDIKIENRQLLWSTIRYLFQNHSDKPDVASALNRIENGRFPNLRTFLYDLQNKG